MKNCRLYAFTHAGGSSKFYENISSLLDVELEAIDYAGHGLRFGETLYANMDDLVVDMKKNISTDKPYAFIGYSLGCTVAYILLKKFSPSHLYMCANTPPYFDDGKDLASLDDKSFWEEMNSLGGMPQEFFNYPDLMDLYLPIIKNDVRLEESVRTCELIHANCPIDVFYGTDMTDENMREWSKCSDKVTYHKFGGNHFFMNESYKEIAKIINETI